MPPIIVYRIQDADGRGPWKPGFSTAWIEPREDHDNLLPWYAEIGPIRALQGEAVGSGCLTIEGLRRWFTPTEYARLLSFGYKAVAMEVGRIFGNSQIQVVFGRAKPLAVDVTTVELY